MKFKFSAICRESGFQKLFWNFANSEFQNKLDENCLVPTWKADNTLTDFGINDREYIVNYELEEAI